VRTPRVSASPTSSPIETCAPAHVSIGLDTSSPPVLVRSIGRSGEVCGRSSWSSDWTSECLQLFLQLLTRDRGSARVHLLFQLFKQTYRPQPQQLSTTLIFYFSFLFLRFPFRHLIKFTSYLFPIKLSVTSSFKHNRHTIHFFLYGFKHCTNHHLYIKSFLLITYHLSSNITHTLSQTSDH
jgi:hypothetical protein